MKTITVKVIPNAKVEQIQENIDGSLKVWIKGQSKEGEANKALVKLLAKYYNTNISAIKIVKGFTSRNKIINITN